MFTSLRLKECVRMSEVRTNLASSLADPISIHVSFLTLDILTDSFILRLNELVNTLINRFFNDNSKFYFLLEPLCAALIIFSVHIKSYTCTLV